MVAKVAKQVETAFPLACPPSYFLLSHEDESRCNGYASKHYIWDEESERHAHEPYIVLHGKRIPLHPAMTRYLVAHEYGHCVDYWIQYQRGDSPNADIAEFRREYAALRGVEPSAGYGGLKWHSNIGELLANDFRIVVCGVEPEFWPHPGFAHPYKLPEVSRFWQDTVMQFAHNPDQPGH